MKTRIVYFFFLLFIVACGTETPPLVPPPDPPPHVTALEDVTTNFTDFSGYNEFVSNCQTCHSLRYITMQPDFPKKTWKATVDKMIHKFGAPIPDSTENIIVDFLMKVRGKTDTLHR